MTLIPALIERRRGPATAPPGRLAVATPTTGGGSHAAPQEPVDPVETAGNGPSRATVVLSLAGLLLATAALYIIGLSKSGYANSFYSAAAQAGSQSWKAWFFGSLDAANYITVDKPPAALWVMGLSVRIFGLNSWSILVPEALMGVASVGLLYATIRRSLAGTRDGRVRLTHTAHWAAIAGGLTLAVTPSAALMFRYNNPDALLVLLEVAASWCVVRATQTASRKHLALGGALVGLGFLTKMLQAFLVLPAFAVAYAVAAPATWRKKFVDLLTAFGSMVLGFGWYVAVFELVPTSWRPYMGGSQNNSLLELAFGYNGLGRITGNETGGLGNGGSSSSAGVLRIFQSTSGGMISWLVPAALIVAVFAWVVLGRGAWANLRGQHFATAKTQANSGLLVWALSLLVTGAIFSSMSGIYHDYYTVALAPGIAGTVAIGFALLWQRKDLLLARAGMAVATCATGVWAVRLLLRAGGSWDVFGGIIAIGATLAALGLLFGNLVGTAVTRTSLVLAVIAALAGPTAYSVNTAETAHTGAIVTAGPVSGGFGGGGTGKGGPGGGQAPGGTAPGGTGQTGTAQTGTAPAGTTGNTGTTGGTSQTGTAPAGTTGGTGTGTSQTGTAPTGGQGPGGTGGGMGGMLDGASVSSALTTLLQANSSDYTWVAATVGSSNAASYELATGDSVMALGGYNGTDASTTLAQFKQLVAQGKVHYFIGSGSVGMGQATSGSDDAAQIAAWVKANFTAKTVGGTTVYDLTAAK